jgi:diamine N-acetyltransferase
MDVIVRETNLRDALDLSNVAQQTFALACPQDSDIAELQAYCIKNLRPSVFEKLISDQNSYVSLASINNEVAGFAVLIFDNACYELPKLTKPVELQKFYLKPEYHGEGVAQILMNDAVNRCQKKDYKNIWLSVFSGNKKAIRFYSKCGFIVTGQTNFIMGCENHLDYLMVANIS